MSGRGYVILRAGGPSQWIEVGTVDAASSARSAIRAYLDDEPVTGSAEFVAVPARSWRPVRAGVETTTRLVFEASS